MPAIQKVYRCRRSFCRGRVAVWHRPKINVRGTDAIADRKYELTDARTMLRHRHGSTAGLSEEGALTQRNTATAYSPINIEEYEGRPAQEHQSSAQGRITLARSAEPPAYLLM